MLNILGASAVSVALGIETDAVAEGVRRCPGAPGRLEAVPGAAGRDGAGRLCAQARRARGGADARLRRSRRGRIICVFGCGGDRDRGKRPIMGEIAGRLADTRDSDLRQSAHRRSAGDYRRGRGGTECRGLGRIARQTAGDAPVTSSSPIGARRSRLRFEVAAAGDIVLIAGKGHEDYQLVAGRRLDFDDRAVVRALVAERGHASGA